MTREEIEEAAEEDGWNLNQAAVVEIAIRYYNLALEEAAKLADPVNKTNPNRNGAFIAKEIRARKIT